MDRCWLKGAQGDALNTVLAAAGYNLRWLMRALLRLLFLFLNFAGLLTLKTEQKLASTAFSNDQWAIWRTFGGRADLHLAVN